MKKALILFFILFNLFLFSRNSIPLFVESQENIFRKIALTINQELPQKISILIFRLLVLNGNKDISEKVNKNFEIIMKSQQFIYKYSIDFTDDIKNKDYTTDYSFLDNYNEQELIAYAGYLQKDAVLLASVTIFDEYKKNVWDSNSGKFREKNIALIQGNIFNTDSGDSLIRFSYYFLID